MWREAFCCVFLTVLVTGCEHAGGVGELTAPAPLNRIQEDPAYRLSEVERAALLPYFDADALERLLQLVPDWERADVLKSFSKPVNGKSGGLLVKLGHPRLDALLEEVWAPFWDTFTVEAMDGYPAIFPGRDLAKQRRAAASARIHSEPQPGVRTARPFSGCRSPQLFGAGDEKGAVTRSHHASRPACGLHHSTRRAGTCCAT